ncbi:hypothetical protein ACN6LA_000678, partial [Streptomyces sp. SAS_269]
MTGKKAEHALVEQWRDILSLHARTQCELDRALHGHGLCASDFEVPQRPHITDGDIGSDQSGRVAWSRRTTTMAISS